MRTRILEGEALAVLADVVGGPFYQRPDVVAKLGNCQVVVLETTPLGEADPEIVAYWPIWVAVHLEPLWLDARVRKHPTAARQLVEAMRAQLALHRIDTAFAVIGHGDLATHLPLAARLGFKRMSGDLFFIDTEDANGSSGGTGDQPGGPVLHESGREQAHRLGDERRDDGPPKLGDEPR